MQTDGFGKSVQTGAGRANKTGDEAVSVGCGLLQQVGDTPGGI